MKVLKNQYYWNQYHNDYLKFTFKIYAHGYEYKTESPDSW